MKTSELLHFTFRSRDPLPGKALCPVEHIHAALAEVRGAYGQFSKHLEPADGVPLLLFEAQGK